MLLDQLIAIAKTTDFQARLAAVLLTGVVTWVLRLFGARVRILWGVSHGFTFRIPQAPGPDALLHTGTVSIKNEGRKPAEDLEIHFNYQPQHLQIWPTFNYTSEINPEGRYCIKLKGLGKKEWLTVELASVNANLPEVLRVRTKEREWQRVPLLPTRVPPKWVVAIMFILMALGLMFLFELIVRAVV